MQRKVLQVTKRLVIFSSAGLWIIDTTEMFPSIILWVDVYYYLIVIIKKLGVFKFD